MTKPKPKLKSKPAAATATSPKASGGKSIVESAQHIWLAGLGAFAKAQDEGTRLFEALVREGVSLEQKTRKLTTGKAEEARVAMEAAVGQVKERSQETWDKLEKVFENRVSRALNALGVPGSTELKSLTARVEELAREVHKLNAKSAPKVASKPAAAHSVRRIKDELADVARELESEQLRQVNAKRPGASAKAASKKPAAKKPAAGKSGAKKKAAR
ncbi:MAG: poly(hydroxyalcanoate) granule associated protein [Gammaproteobacteria bacterium]|nr:MAG: poly(hydroxyalcanoate) granule associated protein [Gammaproteobacteria bacterium]